MFQHNITCVSIIRNRIPSPFICGCSIDPVFPFRSKFYVPDKSTTGVPDNICAGLQYLFKG